MSPGVVLRAAHISPDGELRYSLDRHWASGGSKSLILLANPSTADGSVDDPTVRRLLQWHRSWGYTGFTVVNLIPYRASRPAIAHAWMAAELMHAASMRLARNRQIICECAEGKVAGVVGYGNQPDWMQAEIGRILVRLPPELPLFCLGQTRDGSPIHPMARGRHRLPDRLTPIPFVA